MSRRLRRIAVLGGSTPFTCALVEALRNVGPRLPRCELALLGRDRDALSLVGRAAASRLAPLGWSARWTRRWGDALDGADLVVHQIRYDGLEGREAGERLCRRHGVHADETLGPAALLTALRSRAGLARTAAALGRHCPGAWVLHLTNPLSAVSALTAADGVGRLVGVCELPRVTVAAVARLFGRPRGDVEWSYTGLNHRGFVHHLRLDGEELLDELVSRLGEGQLEGVAGATIAALRAVPLKYFALVQGRPRTSCGRARAVAALRRRLLDELRARPFAPPPSLSERYLEWYPQGVVPWIEALLAGRGGPLVGTLPGADGLAREHRLRVTAGSVEPLAAPPPPAPVRAWLRRFERHERAFLAAVAEPRPDRVVAALRADPTVPESSAEAIGAELWRTYEAALSAAGTTSR